MDDEDDYFDDKINLFILFSKFLNHDRTLKGAN